MTENGPVDDLRSRIVGERYYDTETDESFTVVGLTVQDGAPVLSLHQYDDGLAWDEVSAPDLLPPELAEDLGVEEGGIDSGRYVPLGPGPTLEESRRLCSERDHEWTPQPDEIWPDGLPESGSNARLNDRYNDLVRCKRCGLSGSVAVEFAEAMTPWFCARCGNVENERDLSRWVDGWEDIPLCDDCEAEVT